MKDWQLSYRGYDPETETLRETLCAIGNGFIVSRACAPDAVASEHHYPGTYMSGGYNRLTSKVGEHEIENEDLVNLPNWLPLSIRIGGGDWLGPENVEYVDYAQDLDIKAGVLRRVLRLKDAEGRITRWEEQRIVSMDDARVAALSVTLTAENWSGPMSVRAAVDGGVINWGVARYRQLDGRHLETLHTEADGKGLIALRSRFRQARREVALAARTTVTLGETAMAPTRSGADEAVAWDEFDLEMTEGAEARIEKIAIYVDSKDNGITEPLMDARDLAAEVDGFDTLLASHSRAWAHLWEEFDLRMESEANDTAQMNLRLHISHLLQTASRHSVGRDVGIPPRGWNGEAYRGHIMWDELFIFPYLTLRKPLLTRSLLVYRHRRLNAAREAAKATGARGAMFPWMSGSNGREETQLLHLNPKSGRWNPDNTWRQRHVGAAVAYNVWQYIQATYDLQFVRDYGAELFLEIARFWGSIAETRSDGRYDIRGVMGPDEFHTAYPGRDPNTDGGLDNNAYTNVMAAWILARAEDMLDFLGEDERRRLCERLDITVEERRHWLDVSRGLYLEFSEDGILSQFEGYGALQELDWDRLNAQYEDTHRIDRILEAEGDDPNNYKVSKQADLLMLFYLFSSEEMGQLFNQLGYAFAPEMIGRNIEYYMQRTSHGSTLSKLVHAWVLARADRHRSWQLALQALNSDIGDVQGGTTSEGVHLGAMAGTVDLVQRCYTGLEMRGGALRFNPRLPEEVSRLISTVRYRGQILDIEVTREELVVASRVITAAPVTIAYRGQFREITPGQRVRFRLFAQ